MKTDISDAIRDIGEIYERRTNDWNVFLSDVGTELAEIEADLRVNQEWIEGEEEETGGAAVVYDYEPDETEILEVLLPRNMSVQVFRSLLENNASEHGARMSAMDNATRNAGEMIDSLTLNYNRTRQAFITKELIEIISGAEAV